MSAVGAEAQGRNRPSSGIEAHGWIKPSTSELCSLKPPIAQNGALGFDGCGLSLVGVRSVNFSTASCRSVPFRLGRLLTIILAASSLTACGPRTLRSWLFPETYTVSSTIEFRMPNGSVRTQTQRYRCKIMDTTDAINGSLGVDSVGDRHWLKYPNGSVLIVGALQPCRWTTTPKRGLYEKEPMDAPSNTGYLSPKGRNQGGDLASATRRTAELEGTLRFTTERPMRSLQFGSTRSISTQVISRPM